MENKNADPSNNIVRNWLSGIAIVLVAIVAVTYAIHRKDTISPVVAGGEDSATTSSATSSSDVVTSGAEFSAAGIVTTGSMGETISVADQPAGRSLDISSMTLAKRSWVAVKDTDGVILGAGLFPASATSGSVPLLRATKAGNRYEVLIYVDNGDKIFNFHKDMVVVAADGSPVSTAFNAK